MRHNTKTVTRNSGDVVSLHLEMRASLNKRLEKYVEEFGMSKRQIIETAVFMWMNQVDKGNEENKV